MKNLLNIILVLCVWACSERTQARRGNGDTDFHTIQHSTLFPSTSSCGVPSPQESMKNSSLYVVHRYGPCSGLATASPTHEDILREDQARVNSIHSKLSQNFHPSQSTELPARSENPRGTGNYIVTIGIGTPKLDQSLEFDTGSDLTWIQCEPCRGDSCYPQREPIFNPSSSSSYSIASCTSPACASLNNRDIRQCMASSNCIYKIRYGDNSTTVGDLAKENFTLTNSVFFNGVYFGCGHNNHGIFGEESAGLLGLGRGSLSFPSQTAAKYNKIFSYCIPSSPSSTGHLTFGSAGISNSVKFTPIPSSSPASFYGLDIIGISVGSQKLEIPSIVFSTAKGIIDSGSVITRLPPKAYVALRDAFKKQMSNYKFIPGRSPYLDTCYDFTGVEEMNIPRISFTFGGGVVVDLGAVGVLYQLENSQACLAFADSKDDTKRAIFGNTQQKTLQVVYDGPGRRIGFAANGCA